MSIVKWWKWAMVLATVCGMACPFGPAHAQQKKKPSQPQPPLTATIRPFDDDYPPQKWPWDNVGSVRDPVSGEMLFIGGRIGGLEKGHVGHWALGADGKTWRELKGESTVLDPLRAKAHAARQPAKRAEAAARNLFYATLEKPAEEAGIKGEPARLVNEAVQRTGELLEQCSAVKAQGWEAESVNRAKRRIGKALESLKSAQAGFRSGQLDAALLKHCFDAQWALDEAADCLASSPGPREAPVVAADPDAKCVVVFGGHHGDYALSDTWIYDCPAKTWKQLWPKVAPSARFQAKLEWSAEQKALLLSGGQTLLNKVTAQVGEMPAPAGAWQFSVEDAAWTGAGGVEPGTRIYRTIVPSYDPRWFDAAARGDRKAVEDWIAELPANTWTAVPKQPSPGPMRDWGNAIFDPDRDRIYRWSGGHEADPSNGMGTYHPAINRWSQPFVPEIMPKGSGDWAANPGKGMSFNGRPDCANHTYLHCAYDLASKKVVCVAVGGTGIFDPDLGDFECNIAHPFNRYVYQTCTAGTPQGVVVWSAGYFGLLDVKTRTWKKLPVAGKMLTPQTDGSAFCYDSKHDALWLTNFTNYQKPSGNIWRYDMKTGVVEAMNPANAETIGKAKGFNDTIRESVYIPTADIVLYNNFVKGKQVAYDCAKNRWVTTNLENNLKLGTVSDTLTYDAKRSLIWNLHAYQKMYVLKLDPKALVLADDPAK